MNIVCRLHVIGNDIPQCRRHETGDCVKPMEDRDSRSVEVHSYVRGEDLGEDVESFLVGGYCVEVDRLLDCDCVDRVLG